MAALRNCLLANSRHTRVKFPNCVTRRIASDTIAVQAGLSRCVTTRVLAQPGEGSRTDGRASLASAAPRPRQWDGVMITTILEVLVAVVVLIVIIAVAALHFLRADDSDTFDDMPDEPRRSRRHPAEPADDEIPELTAAAPGGRSRRVGSGREDWAGAERGLPVDGQGAGFRQHDSQPKLVRAGAADSRSPGGRDPQRGPGSDSHRPDSHRPDSHRPDSHRPDNRSAERRSAERRSPDSRGADGHPDRQGTASAPRPSAGRRPAAAPRAADSDSWDALSDVDYWAEVASDKPFTPAAAAAGSGPARPGRRRLEPAAEPPGRRARGSPPRLCERGRQGPAVPERVRRSEPANRPDRAV